MRRRGLSNEDIRTLQNLVERRRERQYDPNKAKAGTDGPGETRCDECESRITVTDGLGEVGHELGCPRRADKYEGMTGRKQPHPSKSGVTGD